MFKCCDKRFGLNLREGGGANSNFTEEARQNMIKAKKNQSAETRIIFSEQHKENLRLSHLGHKPTEETKQKLSECRKGEKNHFLAKNIRKKHLKKCEAENVAKQQNKK